MTNSDRGQFWPVMASYGLRKEYEAIISNPRGVFKLISDSSQTSSETSETLTPWPVSWSLLDCWTNWLASWPEKNTTNASPF